MAQAAGGWLNPHDPWPKHSDPSTQDALDKAHRAGWLLRVREPHAYGSLYCRHPNEGPHCMVVVKATLQEPGRTAAVLTRNVEACHHEPATDARTRLNVEKLLDTAQKFARSAEALLKRAAYQQHLDKAEEQARTVLAMLGRVDELIGEADGRIAEFDLLVESARTLEAEAQVAESEARGLLLGTTESDDSAESSVVRMIEKATSAATTAESAVGAILRSDQAERLKTRITDLRQRLADLAERAAQAS